MWPQLRGIEVAEDWMHQTANGRALWITHGDYFDGVIQCAKWLAHVGDSLYEFTLKLNRTSTRCAPAWVCRIGAS